MKVVILNDFCRDKPDLSRVNHSELDLFKKCRRCIFLTETAI